MKYIEEFRQASVAKAFTRRIHHQADNSRHYHLMEFCGGHTHAIYRYGLTSLLPKNVHLIHGPGCPVCVLPIHRIDEAIALASLPDVIFCSYGDMLRVPGSSRMSLLQAKARGADVRMVYSIDDALAIAKAHPEKQVIFFAIGFETTTPPTAFALKQAKASKQHNFSVFCNHVLTPVAMEQLLKAEDDDSLAPRLDGFIGPAHVSIVIGSQAYERVCQTYEKPIVISGFEPLDILHSISLLLDQLNHNRCVVENQYTRAVSRQGSQAAQAMMQEVFELRATFEWRGLGDIPFSALQIQSDYEAFDAEKKFSIQTQPGQEHKQCDCGNILRGIKKPTDCKLFAKACTPETPLGACMVSSEGACAAMYTYGRHLAYDRTANQT